MYYKFCSIRTALCFKFHSRFSCSMYFRIYLKMYLYYVLQNYVDNLTNTKNIFYSLIFLDTGVAIYFIISTKFSLNSSLKLIPDHILLFLVVSTTYKFDLCTKLCFRFILVFFTFHCMLVLFEFFLNFILDVCIDILNV